MNSATSDELAAWLPERMPDSNKGSHGHVGIIGSAVTYAGATILVARAALRAGCGLATIYTLPGANAIYKVALPEATSVLLNSGVNDHFDGESGAEFARKCKEHTVLAIGPGLGTEPSTKTFFERVLEVWKGPLVIDADGLNLLSGGLLSKINGRADCLLTPHPGEMARLLRLSVKDVQAGRGKVAREFAMEHKVCLLLKGAGTLVARPDGQVWIVPGAEAALAKGGTGDVLTGVIASLFAQGMPMWQAAVLGATAHLESGRMCAERFGRRGVLASEVADGIGLALDGIEDGDGAIGEF